MKALRFALLFIVLPIGTAHVGYQLTGCAGAIREVESYSDPSDDAALSRCRKLMRGVKADGGTDEDAYRTYYLCTEDAGLR